MHIANCRCLLNPGHDVAKNNVTPAEVLILRVMHKTNNRGADPIKDLITIGQVKRTKSYEVARLRAMYQQRGKNGISVVDILFPGVSGEGIPDTFEGVWPMLVTKQETVEMPSATASLNEEILPLDEPVPA